MEGFLGKVFVGFDLIMAWDTGEDYLVEVSEELLVSPDMVEVSFMQVGEAEKIVSIAPRQSYFTVSYSFLFKLSLELVALVPPIEFPSVHKPSSLS